MRGTLQQRLWAKVDRSNPDGCWEFIGARTPYGYGKLGIGPAGAGLVSAHRVAYEDAIGPIPEGMIVRHTCDNPPCCNPAHLVIGTQGDNLRDAFARGRKRPPLEKIPPGPIRDALVADSRPYRVIAAEYGVHLQTVFRLKKHRKMDR